MKTALWVFFLIGFAGFNGNYATENVNKLVIDTELGSIIVEVYPEKAPLTVENFLAYVDAKAYDGSTFFRVVRPDNQPQDLVKIEVIQGGMVADEKSRAPILHETTEKSGLRHVDGAISMARGQPGSAQCSFFICINDQPALDFGGKRNPDGLGFAAFGRVISGMDVVRKIQIQKATGQMLEKPISIKSISRSKT